MKQKMAESLVIMAAMSPVFEAMFKEGSEEHRNNFVNIEDIDRECVPALLVLRSSRQIG